VSLYHILDGFHVLKDCKSGRAYLQDFLVSQCSVLVSLLAVHSLFTKFATATFCLVIHRTHIYPPPSNHTPLFLTTYTHTSKMGIEEFLPAILVIAVIYYAIRWFMGPSTSFPMTEVMAAGKADKIGQTSNPDGSIPGVTASMVSWHIFTLTRCLTYLGGDDTICFSGYTTCQYRLSSIQDSVCTSYFRGNIRERVLTCCTSPFIPSR
jgi:hypothetical protein